MALFQDTGNYLCNWSMAQPLVWGNPESQIGGKPIKDFALGPPQLVYPKGYLRETDHPAYQLLESHYDYTGFNFKFGGPHMFLTETPTDCTGQWKEYCEGKEFYNPLNKKYISQYNIFDYISVKNPWSSCKKGMAMYPGHGICSKYICDKYDSFTLITPYLEDPDGNQTNITCTKDDPNRNITIRDPYYYSSLKNLTCVHPELFFRTVKLHEMHFVRDPFNPDMSVTQLDDPYGESSTKTDANTNTTSDSDSKSNSNNKIKIIVPCVVCGVIVIAIIVIVIIFIIKKRKSNTDISEDESINNLKDDEV